LTAGRRAIAIGGSGKYTDPPAITYSPITGSLS
jgi:hypothetical protein